MDSPLGVGPAGAFSIIVKSSRMLVESSNYSWRDVRGGDTSRTLLLAAAGRDDKLSIHAHDTAHISLTPGITHLPSHGDCSELL